MFTSWPRTQLERTVGSMPGKYPKRPPDTLITHVRSAGADISRCRTCSVDLACAPHVIARRLVIGSLFSVICHRSTVVESMCHNQDLWSR